MYKATKPVEFVAYLGRTDLSLIFERGGQISYPEKVLLHPDWNILTEKYDADLAIVLLEHDVTFNSYILPICLVKIPQDGSKGIAVINDTIFDEKAVK